MYYERDVRSVWFTNSHNPVDPTIFAPGTYWVAGLVDRDGDPATVDHVDLDYMTVDEVAAALLAAGPPLDRLRFRSVERRAHPWEGPTDFHFRQGGEPKPYPYVGPVPGAQIFTGDGDGDGVTTPGVVRGTTFLLKNDVAGGAADEEFTYGRATDTPLVGDRTGIGCDDIGVYRRR